MPRWVYKNFNERIPLFSILVASEDSVIADLKRLRILWDEGPDDPKATYGPYSIDNQKGQKFINDLID